MLPRYKNHRFFAVWRLDANPNGLRARIVVEGGTAPAAPIGGCDPPHPASIAAATPLLSA
ncbi:MAG TPA: hypothetical protein VNU22_03645 [Candidatus Acidoferrum sp.]|jgi:hypothetical protein|nr:hypothetical protein [Candidatus Acidoferrum sp.]